MTDKKDEMNDGILSEEEMNNTSVSDDSVETVSQTEPETREQVTEREREEYLAGWQRSQAEMANMKKRHAEERTLFSTLGKESLLNELIPILDNFDSAFANKDVWESVDSNWRVGIEYIHSQLMRVLESNGVSVFGAVGDVFDHALHESLEMVSVDDEAQKNTIVDVMQKGYKIGDRVLRPAKVKVGE